MQWQPKREEMSAIIITMLDKLWPHLKHQNKSSYKLLSKMTRLVFLYTTKSSFIWIRMGKQTLIIVKKKNAGYLKPSWTCKEWIKKPFYAFYGYYPKDSK